MRKFLLGAFAAGTALMLIAPAEARQGCGVGTHRGPAGFCQPNRRDAAVIAPALRIGVFYPGHGYWDGGRYWGHRYRWHRGWRYR